MAANREVVQRRTFAKGFTRNFSVFLDDVVVESLPTKTAPYACLQAVLVLASLEFAQI